MTTGYDELIQDLSDQRATVAKLVEIAARTSMPMPPMQTVRLVCVNGCLGQRRETPSYMRVRKVSHI